MKIALLFLSIPSILVLAGTFFTLGVDITGHVIPFLGVGYGSGEDSFVVTFGFLYDFESSAWGIQQSLVYSHHIDPFRFGLAFKALWVSKSAEMLYLLGPYLGYSFGPMGLDLSLFTTLPLGATKEFEFPVPYVTVSWDLK